MVTLYQGDCLDILPTLEAQSVHAIITDLPYGTTACKWDSVIPFAPMWEQVKRVLKPRGVFVTTASQPFTSALVMSNLEWFKYEWVWDKKLPTGFATAKYKPMKQHENILVFSSGAVDYHPQMKPRETARVYNRNHSGYHGSENLYKHDGADRVLTHYFPRSLLEFSNADNANKIHPTQKPVALYEYLIRTYTNPGETVLDFCAGSGTTGEAAIKTGRDCILIEKDAGYFEIIQKRMERVQQQPMLEGV